MKAYKKILFVFVAVLTGMISFSSLRVKAQPSITWEKLYGYPYSDEGAYDVCESGDGNFFVVGSSGNSFSSSRIYVLKINQFGDTLWTRKYNAGHYAYGVTATIEYGCVLTGYGIDSLYIMKLDFKGNIVWQKFYPTTAICFDIQRVSDGGYIACGYNLFKGYFMKVDSIGNLKWEQNYTVSNQMGFASCLEAIDGGYIAGGTVRDPDTAKTEILKVDINGNTIWERRFKILNGGATITNILKLNKKYIIFGNSNSIYFSILTLEGYPKFIYIFNDIGREGLLSANVIDENKFVYTSQIFPQTGDTMYVRNWSSDSSGTILSEKFYRTRGYMALHNILPLKNNDIIFAGIFKPVPNSNDDYSYIIRTDSSLNSKPNHVNLINESIPEEFNLYQNYPNPFNPSTNIKFDIIKAGFVEIKIYDTKGKLIQTLLNKNLNVGSYQVKFLSYKLSSGIYFYELIFNNKIVSAKKMLLLK